MLDTFADVVFQAVPREAVRVAGELEVRPPRLADMAAENAALHRLAKLLTGTSKALLQELVDTAVE